MTILSDGCPDIFRLVHLLLPPSLLGLLEEEDEEEVEMAAYWPITGGLLRPIALLLNCGRASKAGGAVRGRWGRASKAGRQGSGAPAAAA